MTAMFLEVADECPLSIGKAKSGFFVITEGEFAGCVVVKTSNTVTRISNNKGTGLSSVPQEWKDSFNELRVRPLRAGEKLVCVE